jgi:hypothetical protein
VTDTELRVVFIVSLVVLAAIAWANAIERAERRKQAALTPIVPSLPVAEVHIATAWRRR